MLTADGRFSKAYSNGFSINLKHKAMAKFNFSITAHVGNDMMLVFSRTFSRNMTDFFADGKMVLAMCLALMRYRDWTLDDGDDAKGTTYCQYVSYDKANHNNYLLAVWTELDENGCMKL